MNFILCIQTKQHLQWLKISHHSFRLIRLKPCPFGLIKRLDPVIVIFFKKCQKNYKCWINCISKKFTIGSANTCNFFLEMKKKLISKKNTTMGFRWCCDPIVVIFFETKFFSFSKKIASVGWSSRCIFFWSTLDPTLVFFFDIFWKKLQRLDQVQTF